MKTDKMVDYIVYTIGYGLSFISSRQGYTFISGSILILVSLLLFLLNYKRSSRLADLRGLFSLSWVGGQGVACLQLSRLQTDWESKTWLCFFAAYFCFMLGYDFMAKKSEAAQEEQDLQKNEQHAKRIFVCIVALCISSVTCFILEAVIVGFIPLFSPEPHAYSYFHVSGVHYFTISCILIPALTVLYCKLAGGIKKKQLIILILGNVVAAAIPVLCVSRFQLLFAVGFAAVTYVMLYHHITWKMILGAVVVMIPMYVLLTVARRHDVSYLNSIFEMKNGNTPIFITQPYMYVANNYENFNCMVQQLAEHTKGMRMLFPFWALTGLKFIFPQVVSSPIFTTKPELTTLTMFYDAYYDFGVIGMIVFSFVLGVAAMKLTGWIRKSANPVAYLFYGQIAIYLGLSFFTTWFSNPTTWFWLVITGMMYLYVGFNRKAPVADQKSRQKR